MTKSTYDRGVRDKKCTRLLNGNHVSISLLQTPRVKVCSQVPVSPSPLFLLCIGGGWVVVLIDCFVKFATETAPRWVSQRPVQWSLVLFCALFRGSSPILSFWSRWI